MLLQREPVAGLHDNALDLVTFAIIDGLIRTPGAMPLEMIHVKSRHTAVNRPLAQFPVGSRSGFATRY